MADMVAVRTLERRNERIDAHIRRLLETLPVGGTTTVAAVVRVVNLAFLLGTPGTPLAVGDYAFVRLGLNGPAEVLSWSMAALVGDTPTASDVVVDVLTGATLATLSSITGTAEPELTADIELTEQPITGWGTTAIVDPSWVQAIVESADGTVEVVGLTLRLRVLES